MRAASATALLFEPETMVWRPVAMMAYRRAAHTATALEDGRVIVIGGRNASYDTGAVEVWSPL